MSTIKNIILFDPNNKNIAKKLHTDIYIIGFVLKNFIYKS